MLKCLRQTDQNENVYKYYRETIKSRNEKLYNCVLNISESNAESASKIIVNKNKNKNKVTINKLLSKVNNINSNFYKNEKELGDLLDAVEWDRLNKYELIKINLVKKLLLYNIINNHISSSFSVNFNSKFFNPKTLDQDLSNLTSYNGDTYNNYNNFNKYNDNKDNYNRDKDNKDNSNNYKDNNLNNYNRDKDNKDKDVRVINELLGNRHLRRDLRNKVILEKIHEVIGDKSLGQKRRNKYLLLLVKNYDLNYESSLLLEVLEKYVKSGVNLEKEDDFNLGVYSLLLFFQNKLSKWTKWPKLVYYYDLHRRNSYLHFKVPLVNDLNRFSVSVDYESFPVFKSCGLLFWHSKGARFVNYWPTLPLYSRVRVGRSRSGFGEISGIFSKLSTLDRFILGNYFNLLPKTNLDNPGQRGHFLYLLLDKSFVLPHVNKWVLNSDLESFSEDLELNLLFNDDIKLIVNNYKYYFFVRSVNNPNNYSRNKDNNYKDNNPNNYKDKNNYKDNNPNNYSRDKDKSKKDVENSLLKKLLVLSDLNNLLLISRKLKIALNFGKNYANLNKIVKYLSANFFQSIGARSCYNVLDVLNSIINGRNLSNNNKSILNSYFYLYCNVSDNDAYFSGNNYVIVSKVADKGNCTPGTTTTSYKLDEVNKMGVQKDGVQNLTKIVDLNKLLFILLLVISNNSKCNLNLVFNILTRVEVGHENSILFLGILIRLFKNDSAHNFLFKHYFERITELLGRGGDKDKDLMIVKELLSQNLKHVSYKFDLNAPYYNKKFVLIHYLNAFYNHLFSFSSGNSSSNICTNSSNIGDNELVKKVDVTSLYDYCYNNLLYYSNNLSDQVDDIIYLLIGLISLIYLYDSSVVTGHKLSNNINILSNKPFIISYSSLNSPPNYADNLDNKDNDKVDKDNNKLDNATKDNCNNNNINNNEIEKDDELVRNIISNYLLNNLHIKITPYTIQQILLHYKNAFSKDSYSHNFGTFATKGKEGGNESGAGSCAPGGSSGFNVSYRDMEYNLEVIKMYKNVKYRRSKRIEKSLMINVRQFSDRNIIYFILFLIYDLNEKCPRNKLYRALDLALIEIPSLLKYLIIIILNDYLIYNVSNCYGSSNSSSDNKDNTNNNNNKSNKDNTLITNKDNNNKDNKDNSTPIESINEHEVLNNNICNKLNGILLHNINPHLSGSYPDVGSASYNTLSDLDRNLNGAKSELTGNQSGNGLDYISLNILFYLIDYINSNCYNSPSYSYNPINHKEKDKEKDSKDSNSGKDDVNRRLNGYYNVIMNGLNKLYLIKCSFIIGSYSRTIYYISNLIQIRLHYLSNRCNHLNNTCDKRDPNNRNSNNVEDNNNKEDVEYLIDIFNTDNMSISMRERYGHLQGSLGEFLAILGECYLNLGDRATYEYLRLYSLTRNLSSPNYSYKNNCNSYNKDNNPNKGYKDNKDNNNYNQDKDNEDVDLEGLEYDNWLDGDRELIGNIWNLSRWELDLSVVNSKVHNSNVNMSDHLNSITIKESNRDKLINDNIKLLYLSIKEKNKSNYVKCIQNILTQNIVNSQIKPFHPQSSNKNLIVNNNSCNSMINISNNNSCNGLININKGDKNNYKDMKLLNGLDNVVLIFENLSKVNRVSSTNYILRIFNEISYRAVVGNKLSESESDLSLSNIRFLLRYISENIPINYLYSPLITLHTGSNSSLLNVNNKMNSSLLNVNKDDKMNSSLLNINKNGNINSGLLNVNNTSYKGDKMGVDRDGVQNLIINRSDGSNVIKIELERNLVFFELYKFYFNKSYNEYYQLLLKLHNHLCNLTGSNINSSLGNNNRNNYNNNSTGYKVDKVGVEENNLGDGVQKMEKEKIETLLCNYYCKLDNRLLYAVAGNLLKLLSNCSGNYRIFFAYSNFLYNLLQSSNDNLIISNQSSLAQQVTLDDSSRLKMEDISLNIDYLYNFTNLLLHTLQVHFLTLVYHSSNPSRSSNSATNNNSYNSYNSYKDNTYKGDNSYSNKKDKLERVGVEKDGVQNTRNNYTSPNSTNYNNITNNNYNNYNNNNNNYNNNNNNNYNNDNNNYKRDKEDDKDVVESTMVRIIYILCHYTSGNGSPVGDAENRESYGVRNYINNLNRDDMELKDKRHNLYDNINSIIYRENVPKSANEAGRGTAREKEDVKSIYKKMQEMFLRYLGAFPPIYYYHVVNQLIGATLDQLLCGLVSRILSVLLRQFPHEMLWYVTYFKYSKYKLLNKNYKLIIQDSLNPNCDTLNNCSTTATGTDNRTTTSTNKQENVDKKDKLEKVVMNYSVLFKELQTLSLVRDLGSDGDKRNRKKALMPLNNFFKNLTSNSNPTSNNSNNPTNNYKDNPNNPTNSYRENILVPKYQMLFYENLYYGLAREFILNVGPELLILKSKQKPKLISFTTFFSYSSDNFNNKDNNNSNKDNKDNTNNPNKDNKDEEDGKAGGCTIINYFNRNPKLSNNPNSKIARGDKADKGDKEDKKGDRVGLDKDGVQNTENKFLLKNELKGDLRKDLRSQDSLKFVNKILVRHFSCEFPLYAIVVITESIGLIQFLPNLITLKQLYSSYSISNNCDNINNNCNPKPYTNNKDNNPNNYNPNKDNNPNNYNPNKDNNYKVDKDKEEKEEKVLVVNYIKNINKKRYGECLKIYESLLGHNRSVGLLFNLISREGDEFEFGKYHEATRSFSLSNSVTSVFGYLLGLGDRHLENILLDKNRFFVIHVDFDLLFNQNLNLLIPELVPFRLTPIIINNLGITNVNVNGIFFNECKKFLKLLRRRKNVLELILRNFLLDPIIQWKNTINNFVGKFDNHLNIFTSFSPPSESRPDSSSKDGDKKEEKEREKDVEIIYINEKVNCDLEMIELIKSATNKHLLSRMFVGWLPWV